MKELFWNRETLNETCINDQVRTVDHCIGQRLKRLRCQKGRSEDYMAGRLGLSASFYKAAEGGHRRLTAMSLYMATHILGLSVSEFFAGLEVSGFSGPESEASYAEVADLLHAFLSIKEEKIREKLLAQIKVESEGSRA